MSRSKRGYKDFGGQAINLFDRTNKANEREVPKQLTLAEQIIAENVRKKDEEIAIRKKIIKEDGPRYIQDNPDFIR